MLTFPLDDVALDAHFAEDGCDLFCFLLSVILTATILKLEHRGYSVNGILIKVYCGDG
jgi:hypothetical protein